VLGRKLHFNDARQGAAVVPGVGRDLLCIGDVPADDVSDEAPQTSEGKHALEVRLVGGFCAVGEESHAFAKVLEYVASPRSDVVGNAEHPLDIGRPGRPDRPHCVIAVVVR